MFIDTNTLIFIMNGILLRMCLFVLALDGNIVQIEKEGRKKLLKKLSEFVWPLDENKQIIKAEKYGFSRNTKTLLNSNSRYEC
jgi:hypothetical protein